jgi:hypothetical protein
MDCEPLPSFGTLGVDAQTSSVRHDFRRPLPPRFSRPQGLPVFAPRIAILNRCGEERTHDNFFNGRRGREAFESLLRMVVEQAPFGENGMRPSDAAMYTWASVSVVVARRVNRTEKKRLALLKQIIGDGNLTELFYFIWLGFVARGQRLPQSRKRFPQIARSILRLFPPKKLKRQQQAKATAQPEGGRMRRWIKWSGAGILALGLTVALGLAMEVSRVKLPGEEMTPSGTPASRSIYD